MAKQTLEQKLAKKNLKITFKGRPGTYQPRTQHYAVEIFRKHGALKNRFFKFSFDLSRLPHCCGVFEVGKIQVLTEGILPAPLKKEAISLLVNVLEEMNPGKCIMVNLVRNVPCNMLRPHIIKKEYEILKRFKNPSSGNIIEVFMNP